MAPAALVPMACVGVRARRKRYAAHRGSQRTYDPPSPRWGVQVQILPRAPRGVDALRPRASAHHYAVRGSPRFATEIATESADKVGNPLRGLLLERRDGVAVGVIEIVECPSLSDTTFGCASAARASDAQVCHRSCSRISGSPASRVSLRNRADTRSGWEGLPSSRQNTRSVSPVPTSA